MTPTFGATDELDLFATCLPGLEELLATELADIGIADVQPDRGGLAFRGRLRDLYRANLCLGLASQVLLRVGSFSCLSLDKLARKAATLPWDQVLRPGHGIQLKATARKSRLYHTGAIVERVLQGIRERVPDVEADGEPGGSQTLLRVRMVHDHCTISLDTSGEPLHRRSYRLHAGKAPLREDLARALLLFSGWTPDKLLIDPFMGSGVVLIEAALIARKLAPGRLRAFGFEDTALFDADLWASVRDEAAQAALPAAPCAIHGSDRDPHSLAAATDNARIAGVLSDLGMAHTSLSEAPDLGPGASTEGGFVVTNPPYGRRLGDPKTLGRLYQSLGSLVKANGLSLALLAMDRRLALRTGLPLRSRALLDNGGLKVRVLGWSPGT